MRKDLLNRFKKAIINIKDIERWLEKSSDKSFVKFSMLKNVLKEIKDLKNRALEAHENCEGRPDLYLYKGIEFEKEVRSFYQNNVKHYRWLLNL